MGSETRTAYADDPLESAVCFALYSALQATVQLYRDLLAPWGLTYQQLLVLSELWHRGAQAPGELAQALRLDSSTVSGLLNRMERDGLVARERHPHDRRGVRVTASDRSQQIRSQLGGVERCLVEAMTLTPDEARDLITTLHGLRDRIAAAPRPERADPSLTAARG